MEEVAQNSRIGDRSKARRKKEEERRRKLDQRRGSFGSSDAKITGKKKEKIREGKQGRRELVEKKRMEKKKFS